MALRGTFQSKYFKNGNEIFVYALVGTTAELEEYCDISEARIGKPAGTWTKNEAGQPLHHVNVSFMKRNGNMPKGVIDLVKSYDGSQYRIDTTKADIAKYQRYEAAKEIAMGEYLAKLELGLIETPTRQNSTPTTPRTTPKAQQATGEPKDLAENIMQMAGEGGEGDLGDAGPGEGGVTTEA
jgi:hypothetical protein